MVPVAADAECETPVLLHHLLQAVLHVEVRAQASLPVTPPVMVSVSWPRVSRHYLRPVGVSNLFKQEAIRSSIARRSCSTTCTSSGATSTIN
jgi:hypothetical protein